MLIFLFDFIIVWKFGFGSDCGNIST